MAEKASTSPISRDIASISLSHTAQRVIAEGVGTFCLVFAGAGAVMVNAKSNGALTLVGIGIVFGLIIMTMIYAIGHVSGAHINPAITIAFAVARYVPMRLAGYYIIAQLVGSTLAALLLRAIFGNIASVGATLPSGSDWDALILEIVITFILMFVVMAVATDTKAVGGSAAIAIGGAIALGVILAGPISGGSMNPARSLGPAIAAWDWTAQWIYIIGPIVGAVLGALAYVLIRQEYAGPIAYPEVDRRQNR
ncbi:MAG TPA: MIP family channel protein [Nitrolancea sp.]|nr:MIP family channel protein [Nitrolancea sp.]